MIDPISTISSGIAITQGIGQFIGYIKGVKNSDVISAYFDWEGKIIECV